jgi:predicted TIM-barrel fold metal-dependent hydrolase
MKRYLLISSDCHHGALWEDFRPYMEPRYLDEFAGVPDDERRRILGENCAELYGLPVSTTA